MPGRRSERSKLLCFLYDNGRDVCLFEMACQCIRNDQAGKDPTSFPTPPPAWNAMNSLFFLDFNSKMACFFNPGCCEAFPACPAGQDKVCGGITQHACKCSDHLVGSFCCHDKDCIGSNVCDNNNTCVEPKNLELGVDCTSSIQCQSSCCSTDFVGYKKCHDVDPRYDECKDDS